MSRRTTTLFLDDKLSPTEKHDGFVLHSTNSNQAINHWWDKTIDFPAQWQQTVHPRCYYANSKGHPTSSQKTVQSSRRIRQHAWPPQLKQQRGASKQDHNCRRRTTCSTKQCHWKVHKNRHRHRTRIQITSRCKAWSQQTKRHQSSIDWSQGGRGQSLDNLNGHGNYKLNATPCQHRIQKPGQIQASWANLCNHQNS